VLAERERERWRDEEAILLIVMLLYCANLDKRSISESER
jgi:hypothetical protein